MQNNLLEPDIIANRWNMEPSTLQQWRWKGKGPKFVKIGRNVFYRPTDIEAFEEQQSLKSTSDTPRKGS